LKFPYSFYFLISYILGVIFSKLNLSFFYFFLLFPLLILLSQRKKIWLYIFLAIFFLIGFYLYKINIPQFRAYENVDIKSLRVVVKDYFEKKHFYSYVVQIEGFNEKGRISVAKKFNIGDELLLENVKLYPLNQSNLYALWDESLIYLIKAQKIYLFKKNNKSSLEKIRVNLREKINDIYSRFGDYKKNFLLAIIIGEKRGLSEEIKNLFVETGTAHLLAISGLHISFLINIFSFLFPFRRIVTKIMLLPILIFYGWIIGDNPPVWRVIGEYVFLLIVFLLRREEDPLNAIFWVAFINLIISPLKLFNISFQLSYMAMLGLLYKPKFPKFMSNYLQEIWESSFWLMLFLAPLNIYYFGGLKPISILANFFSIPIFSIILFFSVFYLIVASFPISYIFEKVLTILMDILFQGLHLIVSHYKISLLISLFLILLPMIMRKRGEDELLGV